MKHYYASRYQGSSPEVHRFDTKLERDEWVAQNGGYSQPVGADVVKMALRIERETGNQFPILLWINTSWSDGLKDMMIHALSIGSRAEVWELYQDLNYMSGFEIDGIKVNFQPFDLRHIFHMACAEYEMRLEMGL